MKETDTFNCKKYNLVMFYAAKLRTKLFTHSKWPTNAQYVDCRKFEGLTPGGWCGCVLGTVAWLAGVRAHCAAADHWSLAGGGWWRGRAAARRALCLHIQRAAAPRPPPPPTLRTCCRADHGDTTPPATCNRESRVIIVVIVVPIVTLFY